VVAESWISQNIPAGSIVGTNRFCFGASAAEVAGKNTIIDSGMEQKLEFYVFDSYSGSSIVPNFRGSNASVAFLEPKYSHFYFIDDKQIYARLLGLFHRPNFSIPDGYSLVERFAENGPEVWVLERD
jgi:hypothetical protein